MISTSHNFLFMHLPKTGGNSIQEALKKYSDDVITDLEPHQNGVERFDVINTKYGTTKHTKYYEYQKILEPEIFSKLHKFTVVRNPWDRCVSRYFFQDAFEHFAKGGSYYELDEPKFNREKFIGIIESTPTLESFLLEDKIKADLNEIADLDIKFLRFENLQRDFNELCMFIGLQPERLKVRNKSKHRPYFLYYDNKTRDLVANRFSAEIELMSYEFDL